MHGLLPSAAAVGNDRLNLQTPFPCSLLLISTDLCLSRFSVELTFSNFKSGLG